MSDYFIIALTRETVQIKTNGTTLYHFHNSSEINLNHSRGGWIYIFPRDKYSATNPSKLLPNCCRCSRSSLQVSGHLPTCSPRTKLRPHLTCHTPEIKRNRLLEKASFQFRPPMHGGSRRTKRFHALTSPRCEGRTHLPPPEQLFLHFEDTGAESRNEHRMTDWSIFQGIRNLSKGHG